MRTFRSPNPIPLCYQQRISNSRGRGTAQAMTREIQDALNDAIVRQDIDGVRQAIQDGADLSKRSGGAPPLHLATMIGSADIARLLIDGGADLDGRDAIGRAALHYAALGTPEADAEMVQLLIDAGADVNAKDHRGCLPLDLAAGAENTDTTPPLVKAGAKCKLDRQSWVQAVSKPAGPGKPSAPVRG